jgi:hypothetical protein
VPVSRRVAATLSATIAVVSVAGLSVSAPAQAAPAATAASCRSGVITRSPSPGPFLGLFGISALSDQAAWAVGYYIKLDQSDFLTLIEHWNGKRWGIVPGPSAAPHGVLYAVAAASPADVWAVGAREINSAANPVTLIDHWDGSAWHVVPSPTMPGLLDALAVASPSDIWAVGFRKIDNGLKPEQTLVEHWDGVRWQVVPSPTPTKFGDGLGGVTVISPDDIWATGDEGISRFDSVPMAEHWDGHAWSVVPMPTQGFTSGLRGIGSAGSGNVWAVGWYDVETPTGTVTFTMSERWNGHHWSIVSTPSPTGDDLLDGVAVLSAHDVWAVGSSGFNRTFVLHWTGHAWTTLPSQFLSGAVNNLWSVSAPSATDLWAAGGGYRTLVMHFCPKG